METLKETTAPQRNPFAGLASEGNCIKVWDVLLDSTYGEDMPGRVRILAEVQKKGAPLKDILFTVAWCSPLDLKKFTKKKANTITVGRFKLLKEAFGVHHDVPSMKNVGFIKELDTLKGFVEQALLNVQEIPYWVDADQFESAELKARLKDGV